MTDRNAARAAAAPAPATIPAARTLDVSLAQLAFAAFVGVVLIFGAGFANSAALHDATHDSRHAIAFPCH